MRVDLDADTAPAERGGCDQGRPCAEKRIEHHVAWPATVQPDAALRQRDRKAGRMVEFLRLGLHSLVGNEPDVPGAT